MPLPGVPAIDEADRFAQASGDSVILERVVNGWPVTDELFPPDAIGIRRLAALTDRAHAAVEQLDISAEDKLTVHAALDAGLGAARSQPTVTWLLGNRNAVSEQAGALQSLFTSPALEDPVVAGVPTVPVGFRTEPRPGLPRLSKAIAGVPQKEWNPDAHPRDNFGRFDGGSFDAPDNSAGRAGQAALEELGRTGHPAAAAARTGVAAVESGKRALSVNDSATASAHFNHAASVFETARQSVAGEVRHALAHDHLEAARDQARSAVERHTRL